MRRRESDASRGDATTSRHDNRMSGWRNERTRRGDLATGRLEEDETAAQREDGKRQCNNQLA